MGENPAEISHTNSQAATFISSCECCKIIYFTCTLFFICPGMLFKSLNIMKVTPAGQVNTLSTGMLWMLDLRGIWLVSVPEINKNYNYYVSLLLSNFLVYILRWMSHQVVNDFLKACVQEVTSTGVWLWLQIKRPFSESGRCWVQGWILWQDSIIFLPHFDVKWMWSCTWLNGQCYELIDIRENLSGIWLCLKPVFERSWNTEYAYTWESLAFLSNCPSSLW